MPVLLRELGCHCWGPQVTYSKSQQLEASPAQPAHHHPLPEGAGPSRASSAAPPPPPPSPFRAPITVSCDSVQGRVVGLRAAWGSANLVGQGS